MAIDTAPCLPVIYLVKLTSLVDVGRRVGGEKRTQKAEIVLDQVDFASTIEIDS
jgi:hypothetical protein